MRFLSPSHRIKTFLNVLMIGVGFIWVVGVSAEPPLGIFGDVTVQNDASNPVPVTVTGTPQFEPVNVSGGVFFDKTCAFSAVLYTVPVGKLLIIDDASAFASDSASASTPGDPGIVDNVAISFSLRTNPSGIEAIGSADHIIHAQRGLPARGGRVLKAYASPNTDVLFLMGGCTVPVNATVHFSGHLIDFP